VKLLERQAQLRDLHAALEGARQGRGSTVLVSGEAGIGKTWLLRAFAARVAEELNEDLTGQDEVRAVMGLNPVGPFGDSAESNRVSLTVS
jgi:predicted ATPase